MAFIISGVSIGDWEKGFYTRATEAGIMLSHHETVPSLDALQTYMRAEYDDRSQDATTEQWAAAYQAFTLSFLAYQEMEREENTISCEKCNVLFLRAGEDETACYECRWEQ